MLAPPRLECGNDSVVYFYGSPRPIHLLVACRFSLVCCCLGGSHPRHLHRPNISFTARIRPCPESMPKPFPMVSSLPNRSGFQCQPTRSLLARTTTPTPNHQSRLDPIPYAHRRLNPCIINRSNLSLTTSSTGISSPDNASRSVNKIHRLFPVVASPLL